MPRLYELVSRHLGCSKTEARQLCLDGLVEESAGTVLDDPRANIAPERLPLPIVIEGEPVLLREHVLVAMHKPIGVITALEDSRHPVAYSLLEDAPLFPHLRPVGRLDLDTSGLLLWTTDGSLLQRLTHPKRAVPRTYHAALARPHGAPPRDFTLEDGHRPNIVALEPLPPETAHPALAPAPEATAWATITIVGGAYHEVRRIFAALGSHVLGLCRVSFGRLELPHDLPAGAHRIVDPSVI